MHQGCQHHHRLQLAAVEPRWARVSPRTCIRDATTASTPGRKRLPSPCYEVNAETDTFQKNSTSSGNIQLATKSTSTLIHTRSIAHPQEHHTCYEVNADTESSQKHSTSLGNITRGTKSTLTLIHPRSIAHPQGTSHLLRSQRRH